MRGSAVVMVGLAVLLAGIGTADAAPRADRGPGGANGAGATNGRGPGSSSGHGKGLAKDHTPDAPDGGADGNPGPDISACADAEALAGFALPAWSTAQWAGEEYWDTIQTADLDGDGAAELVGRQPDGIHAHDFDGTVGQWLPMYQGGSGFFTDEGGWHQPRYYRSITSGDVDGDGRDELVALAADGVVGYRYEGLDQAGEPSWASLPTLDAFTGVAIDSLARSYGMLQTADLDGDGADEIVGGVGAGIAAFRWDPSAPSGWSPLATLDWLPDTGSFGQPQYWSTVQAADLDGDGADELFGRTIAGLESWDYDGATDSWSPLASTDTFDDAAGWDLVQYYSTIQAGDLDGDGRDEVFGRGAGGIVAVATPTSGGTTFTPLPDLTASFTDSPGGWDAEPYYATIQAADVDGDGSAEVLGRGANGLQVWSLHPSAKSWVELASGSEQFTDDGGWGQAWSYHTIQVADLDGFETLRPGRRAAPRDEVLGRGPTGIVTLRWDATTDQWTSPSNVFPAFDSGAEAKAYQAINTRLATSADGVVNAAFGTVRDNYATATPGNLGGGANPEATNWPAEVEAMSRPKGVTRAAWRTVKDQILSELAAVNLVRGWFDDYLADVTGQLFQADALDDTATFLKFDLQSQLALESTMMNLLAGIVRSVAAAAGPVGSVTGGLASAGISAAASADTSATLAAFDGTYLSIQSQLASAFQNATCGLTRAKAAVMDDYGLLQAVGGLLQNDTWKQWTSDEQSIMTAGALRAHATWTWQTLAPTLGHGFHDATNDVDGWYLTGCSPQMSTTCDWQIEPDGESYVVADDSFTASGSTGVEPVDSDMRSIFFDPTSADCLVNWKGLGLGIDQCTLGVPADDVFLGLRGWDLFCGDGVLSFGYCDVLATVQSDWKT